MWFKSIYARAFGPLVEQDLEFKPGLNVVHGPNESGKSTWHAAIAVALCGVRRGAGRNVAAERLEGHHRPWDAGSDDPWFVRTGLVLDDGSHIEIERDLRNRRTDARLADMTGRKFTGLPINNGSEDGSKLLGLDRETFPMTASIRQARIVSDLREPNALQQHLARAATGGKGSTAAGALGRIRAYKREHVGRNQRNSVRPLRKAVEAVEAATKRLTRVERTHREYQELASSLDAHRQEVERLTSEKARVEAQRDFCTANEESDRLDAAIGKLDGWEERFSARDPSQSELPELAGLAQALGGVRSLPQPETTHLGPVDVLKAQFEGLRSSESVPCPGVDEVERCVAPLRASDPPEAARPTARTVAIAAGIAGVAAAFILGVAVEVSYGIVLAVLALAVGWVLSRRAAPSTPDARRDVHEAKSAALRRLEEWKLPLDPVAAVAEASRRIQALSKRKRLVEQIEQREAYDSREDERSRSHEDAWKKLRSLASTHGVTGSDEDVLERVQEIVDNHAAAQLQRDEDVEEWGRFQEALEGRTPQQWRIDATAAQIDLDEAHQRLAGAGVELPDAEVSADQLDEEVRRIDRLLLDASGAMKRVEGRLSQVELASVDVAAAEAQLVEAEAERTRVERLADTLDKTGTFLEKAAENAHQLLAPRLAADMSPWIPTVTNGRYARVEVDPGNLDVTLITASGSRRDARLVSRGTTEQVYLVLRLVLAQVLSDAHEACPVLLDDPTVHADAGRKNAMLDFLLAASRKHQVILFSQEQEVLDWAKVRQAGAVNLIELPEPQPA